MRSATLILENVSQIPGPEAAMYICSSILIPVFFGVFLSRTCFRANLVN